LKELSGKRTSGLNRGSPELVKTLRFFREENTLSKLTHCKCKSGSYYYVTVSTLSSVEQLGEKMDSKALGQEIE